MVLTEAVRMAEGNSSPINNILANNSIMTAAGITDNTTNSKLGSPTRTDQPKIPTAERPMLGGYEQSSTSSRNKQPIYTRDKRTKFTQRENKKWVRLATVLGYLVAVCIPAIALSIYYIGFWDPNYKLQYESHLREKQMEKEHRPQPQQCCTACTCSGQTGTSTPAANRDPRHLASSVDVSDGDPAKIAASRFIYDGIGERVADHAYYHNVLMGKNYVIYGAASDEASLEGTMDMSSPSSNPVTDSTYPSEKITMDARAPHEKRNHVSDGAASFNDGGSLHQQHRQHKMQASH